MKGIYLIDPAEMTAKHLQILQAYLSQNSDFLGVFHDAASGKVYSCVYQEKNLRFQVKSKLVLREKSKCRGQYQYPEFAVVGDKVGSGRYGVVNDVAGSISFAVRPTSLFGFKRKYHRSVIKTQYHFADYPQDIAASEFDLLGMTTYANPKNYLLDDDGFISYIVSRKIPGKPLSDLLSDDLSGKPRLSLDERLQLSINILRALKEGVHDRGIIHRDIKPENVIISDDLSACFIDFGLSRKSGSVNKDGASCGTISFISPDVARLDGGGNPCLDEKSDVYNTGKLLSLIWGANNPLVDERFKDINQILEFVLEGEKPELFHNIQFPASLTAADRDRIVAVVNGMMTVSRCNRMSLTAAIDEFDKLRLSILSAGMSERDAKGLYDAAADSQRLRLDLQRYCQSDDYSLAGMIDMIESAASRLADSPFAVREFRTATDIINFGVEPDKSELLRQCQSFRNTVSGYTGIFNSLLFALNEQIKNQKYFSKSKSNERTINYNHLQYLICHELDKLSFGRRRYSDLAALRDKLDEKLHYFMRVKKETAYISGWTKHYHLGEMGRCIATFCDDIRPDYRNNTLRLYLAQIVLSFVKIYEASHHYSLFHEPAKMPSSAVRYASSLFSTIVVSTNNDQLVAAISELTPPKGLFHCLERKLFASLMTEIDQNSRQQLLRYYI